MEQEPIDKIRCPSTLTCLEEAFTYHSPNELQQSKYVKIRNAAKFFAETVAIECPECPDKTDAVRKIREAVMMANASIALPIDER